MRFLALLALCAVVVFAHEDHHKGHNHFNSLRVARHAHTSFDDFAKKHLDWLSDEEKTEVKKLHDENKEKAREKVLEILEASSGDKQAKGVAQLQAACRELIVGVLGEDVAKELKQMKESGSTTEEISKKVTDLLNAVTDEQKKAKAVEHKYVCEKVYSLKAAASRRRRHEGHHHKTLEEYLQSHLTWLTEAQKAELLQLKKDGKGQAEIQAKVMEFYEAATGDVKEKATADLKAGCEEVLAHLLNEEQRGEIKKLRESGASVNDISAKVAEFVKTITDADKLAESEKYKANCKKIFGVTNRRRRAKQHHTLEDYLESSHLSWLTQLEKESLRKLAQEGKSKEVIQKQVLDYFEATSGELREKATADMQSGCRELFVQFLGAEKTAELKELKESGATKEELVKKGNQLVDEIEDPQQKDEAKFHAIGCRKIFGIGGKRKRHVHSVQKRHEHSLEDLFKTYLSWLTEDQQKKLTELKAEGKSRDELQKQVLEYYDAASDEVKESARQKMQDGCRKLLARVLGEEKANELKTLRESGTPLKDIAEKTKGWIDALTDENVKKSAQEYSTVCNKAFDIQ